MDVTAATEWTFPSEIPAGANWIQKIKLLQICAHRGVLPPPGQMEDGAHVNQFININCTYVTCYDGKVLGCIPTRPLEIPCC